jgi:hypothetical protein
MALFQHLETIILRICVLLKKKKFMAGSGRKLFLKNCSAGVTGKWGRSTLILFLLQF